MALLDMMKGLFSASHMEVELATHLKFGQMLYEQHATIIFKKNILWDWSSSSFHFNEERRYAFQLQNYPKGNWNQIIDFFQGPVVGNTSK